MGALNMAHLVVPNERRCRRAKMKISRHENRNLDHKFWVIAERPGAVRNHKFVVNGL